MRIAWLLLVVAACGEVTKLDPDARSVDADPCTGTCECVADTDCTGSYTVCNDQGTSRTCECSSGYTKGTSGSCEWTGVIRDPGFQSASVWTLGPNAAIDQNLNEAGMIDPGAARYHIDGLCKRARITQGIEMPKQARSQPLVAEITHRYIFNPLGPVLPARPAFGIGSTWREQVLGTGAPWLTARVCLGSGQYAAPATKGRGDQVSLTVMPDVIPSSCTDPNAYLDIDRFEIKPANPNECPAPTTATNGDAEGTGGWQFTASGANGTLATSMIEAAVGEAGSKGVRMFAANRCSNTSATTTLSVGGLASPALSLFNRTTSTMPGVATDLRVGNVDLPPINSSNADQPQKVCIPAFMRGGVVDVRAAMNLSGACADVVNATSVIDNVKVVNDPSCGTDPAVTDGGFESSLSLIGARSTAGKSLARTLIDPSMAHAGSGVLQLSVSYPCDGPSWQGNVVVPPPSGAAGPALSFFYKATPPADYTFAVTTSGATFAPVNDNTWHAGTICLDPKLAGRNVPVLFRLTGGGGTCAIMQPTETALVDELKVTTDAACPAM